MRASIVPRSETAALQLLPSSETLGLAGSHPGWPISVGRAPAQMLWVDFARAAGHSDWDEGMLSSFNAGTRRNIRLSLKTGVVAQDATTEEDLRKAWEIVEWNGSAQGYPTRRWKEFGPVLVSQIRKGHAAVITARLDGRMLGCVYGVLTGQRFSYLMGGTVREEIDLKVGHFTHWHAMKKARDLGLSGYDLTSGGPPGVERFKLGFNPQHIHFEPPRHLVHRPVEAALIRRIYPFLHARRGQLARLSSSLRRLLRRDA